MAEVIEKTEVAKLRFINDDDEGRARFVGKAFAIQIDAVKDALEELLKDAHGKILEKLCDLVVVRGLPESWDDAEARPFFEAYGEIRELELGLAAQAARVIYCEAADAERAARELNGSSSYGEVLHCFLDNEDKKGPGKGQHYTAARNSHQTSSKAWPPASKVFNPTIWPVPQPTALVALTE